jgi:putative flippase GtrA
MPVSRVETLHRGCLRPSANILQRWLRFNLVGVMGIAVQVGALEVFSRALGLNAMWASALAVEVSLLHNFAWHERFTWADSARADGFTQVLVRLIRFNLTNGAISVAGNVAVVWCLAGIVGLPLLMANLIAIGCSGTLNFVVSHYLVFRHWSVARK